MEGLRGLVPLVLGGRQPGDVLLLGGRQAELLPALPAGRGPAGGDGLDPPDPAARDRSGPARPAGAGSSSGSTGSSWSWRSGSAPGGRMSWRRGQYSAWARWSSAAAVVAGVVGGGLGLARGARRLALPAGRGGLGRRRGDRLRRRRARPTTRPAGHRAPGRTPRPAGPRRGRRAIISSTRSTRGSGSTSATTPGSRAGEPAPLQRQLRQVGRLLATTVPAGVSELARPAQRSPEASPHGLAGPPGSRRSLRPDPRRSTTAWPRTSGLATPVHREGRHEAERLVLLRVPRSSLRHSRPGPSAAIRSADTGPPRLSSGTTADAKARRRGRGKACRLARHDRRDSWCRSR